MVETIPAEDSMKTFLASFLISFVSVASITPLLIMAGRRFGFVDGSSRRKIHNGVIPRIGGVGITLGTILPLLLLYIYKNDVSDLFFSDWRNPVVMLGGSVAVTLLGFVDDVNGVRARYKFLTQIFLAAAAWWFGFEISALSTPFGVLYFGVFSLPVTVLWIVGVINAFNLIDGLDGLSSGIAFFVSLTIFILALHNDQGFVALISASMAGAVVGFLVYNFNPAKIFMGDSGSMFIGYVLAILSLKGASKGSTILSLLIPIMAMGLPILDTSLAFVRRFLRNQPIFLADRQHIHHILLSKGLNQRKVVLMLYGVSLSFMVLALLSIYLKDKELFLIMMVFTVIIGVLITKLGYMEMFYSRYVKRREHKDVEGVLESLFISHISPKSLDSFNDLLFMLPIRGFSLIEENGEVVVKRGELTAVHFLDIKAGENLFMRLYWEGVVPTINSRESLMLSIIAKSMAEAAKSWSEVSYQA